jgi:hypothetical protein
MARSPIGQKIEEPRWGQLTRVLVRNGTQYLTPFCCLFQVIHIAKCHIFSRLKLFVTKL